ncbi:helix-turn-helix domain-containing protein [Actinomadura graeca]|uniref:Helix-turn-helix domain-containing protein n=1 Tax=Actinomadura graeca TaxID=2750812 RepID=A0ABX8R837_9ACTN|nr:helix-turn-helix domain-containing protein [Actinomadura graeca]QXJ25932.1 helix-turn-helix domain-containing protein [Actinomadura graeca]
MNRILTAVEAADLLGVCEDAVLGMVADGELPALTIDDDEVLIAEGALCEVMVARWVGDSAEGSQ